MQTYAFSAIHFTLVLFYLCCAFFNMFWGFPGGSVVKNLLVVQETSCHAEDTDLIPG